MSKPNSATVPAAEVVESFDPARYLSGSPAENLKRAHADYEAVAAKVNESAESTSTIRTRIESAFVKTQRRAAQFAIRKVRDGLVEKFAKYPGLATAVLEDVKELTTVTREWSDMQVAAAARSEKLTAEIPEELVQTAEQIKDAATAMYSLLTTMGMEIPDDLPMRNVKGGGETLSFTRLASNNVNVGRGAKRAQYTFTIDGTFHDLPPQEAIMVYAGSWNAFLDECKAQEIPFAGEPFSIEWNGHKISGSIIVDEK